MAKFKKGDRVVFLQDDPKSQSSYIKGDVGIIDEHGSPSPYVIVEKSGYRSCENETMLKFADKENPLIEEARKRYPYGTKFNVAHIPPRNNDNSRIAISDGHPKIVGTSVRVGTIIPCFYTPVVYYMPDKRWAEIIEEPSKSSEGPKIGNVVVDLGVGTTTRPRHIGILHRSDMTERMPHAIEYRDGQILWTKARLATLEEQKAFTAGYNTLEDYINADPFKPSKKEEEFKTGDIVVCISNNINHSPCIGKIGKIATINSWSDYKYWVEFHEGLPHIFCNVRRASDIEINAYNRRFSSLDAFLEQVRSETGRNLDVFNTIRTKEPEKPVYYTGGLDTYAPSRMILTTDPFGNPIWKTPPKDDMDKYMQSPIIIKKAPKSKIISV